MRRCEHTLKRGLATRNGLVLRKLVAIFASGLHAKSKKTIPVPRPRSLHLLR
jgi:hypothetical protein